MLVPYKNAKIAQLGLSLLQWTILKHDLHYTHKDPKVLTHGCFEEICSAQRQDEARIALLAAEGGGVGGAAVVAGAPIIAVPAEEEEEVEQEEEVEDDIDGLLESVVNLDARLI